jgi:enoyl-CoA hydratase/carnithine racemase
VIDETASLGLPEVRRGLVAAVCGLLRLQRQTPFKVASEIFLTGEPISAKRAYELGLVNQVAPAGTAVTEAMTLASAIAANAPLAVAHTKRLLHAAAHAGSDWEDPLWQLNQATMDAVMTSADARGSAGLHGEAPATVDRALIRRIRT